MPLQPFFHNIHSAFPFTSHRYSTCSPQCVRRHRAYSFYPPIIWSAFLQSRRLVAFIVMPISLSAAPYTVTLPARQTWNLIGNTSFFIGAPLCRRRPETSGGEWLAGWADFGVWTPLGASRSRHRVVCLTTHSLASRLKELLANPLRRCFEKTMFLSTRIQRSIVRWRKTERNKRMCSSRIHTLVNAIAMGWSRRKDCERWHSCMARRVAQNASVTFSVARSSWSA